MAKIKKHKVKAGYASLIPFFIAILIFEIAPLIKLVLSSFTTTETGIFTLNNFYRILTTPLYIQAIINSIYISIISGLVGIFIAFIVGNALYYSSYKVNKRVTMLLNMTSNFSGVPLAFAFMVLMGNTGFLTLVGKQYNLPFFSNFNLYSGNGLMLVYIYFQIPLGTLLLLPSFKGIKKEWQESACLLKASNLKYFSHILFPMLLPSILGTFSVLFANALAAYATAYSLVTNNYALLALQITSKYKGDVQIDTGIGGALSIVLIILMIVSTLINSYFTNKSLKGRI